MKNLTLKALFISVIVATSINVQAVQSTYDICIADAENIIAIAIKKGSTAAEAIKQKTDIATCMGELSKIEAKYGDKTKGINPSSVMTPKDRAAWSKLFDSIDAKQFRGVRYLQDTYYH